SYWMGPAIAHTLISFGFEDGRHVVFSLEIRKERGESFSALGGFFRKFEMTLVASEETDIIRTRTNARGEDVYLYRLHGM
ncbi:lipoprotein N-acyltransferase Lnb domain-containing protein, partial [Pseudomonas aeruginosa]